MNTSQDIQALGYSWVALLSMMESTSTQDSFELLQPTQHLFLNEEDIAAFCEDNYLSSPKVDESGVVTALDYWGVERIQIGQIEPIHPLHPLHP